MARELLVPVDGSDPARQALDFACEQYPDAIITAYHVIGPSPSADEMLIGSASEYEESLQTAKEEHARSVLDDADSLATDMDCEIETTFDQGIPTKAILDYLSDNEVDQVIMGSHGRTGFERVVMGSVAEKVTRHAPVPVTIVRPDEDG